MESQITWSPGITLESIERQVILIAFRFYRGNKTATANALGIAVRTLDNKLAQYKVETDKVSEREQDEQRKRDEYLKRARGPLGENLYTGQPHAQFAATQAAAKNGNGPGQGVRVESVANSSEKQAVSVSERKEVQNVSPSTIAASSPRGRR